MRDEPSTQRMRADEVRALIRRLELPPPPAFVVAEGARSAELEPPTLLYRRSSHRRVRSDEPRTLQGLGFFTSREKTATALPGVDGVLPSAHESNVVSQPDAERDAARPTPRVPASVRVRQARRRSLLLGCVIVALLAIAPLLMAIVRRTTGPDAAARAAHVVGAQPSSARSADRTSAVTDTLDPATQQRMDPVRRATELLMEGDSAGALSAFRTLSRAHPQHLALGHVVRSLEQQLRACAEDEAACR